jgi:mannose-1-phosphate guanylyltransferase
MLYAVITAGGSGTRLWPLSRAGNPKFLQPLTGTANTLLQATMERLSPLVPPDRTYVVTGVAHAAAVARQLPTLPAENILVEPSPRDSCAAIGLAAAVIARRDPDAIMGSFAVDHLVFDDARFAAVVTQAVEAAESGLLMTVGITPCRPETGYGYLRCGPLLSGGPARRVEQFAEKPPYEVAKAYLDSGEYLWNASMFVWRVDAFLDELAAAQPALHHGLTRIAAHWSRPNREEIFGEVWPTLPKISVDYAVMEGAAAKGLVGTVPGDFGWNDIGDFDTLGSVLPADEDGNVLVDAGGLTDKPDVLLVDSSSTVVVPTSGRLITALGVHGLVIVDTGDALLVCSRERAQDVKKIVDLLRRRGDSQLT